MTALRISAWLAAGMAVGLWCRVCYAVLVMQP